MHFDGTSDEFEAIVNKNKLLLYSIAYALAGDASADDIVQETFIQAYYNYGSLKNREKLSSWLCAIARNKAYDYVKRIRNSGQISLEVLAERDRDISSDTGPEVQILKNEKRNRLLAEINSLSEKYRETVLLYYFADMSIKEISELLSVPEGTIKFRLSDARRKLKKELKGMFDEERASIIDNNIFERIKEEIEKAYEALRERRTKDASDLCDRLLKDVKELSPKNKEELANLKLLYQAKIDSMIHAEGIAAAEKYIKKVVEISEASEEALWMSGAYNFYAAMLASMGRMDEADRYNRMALEKAEESKDKSYIAEMLYWNGIRAYENKRGRFGLDYFERVLAMKDVLLTDKENNLRNLNTYALSYSAYIALTRCGKKLTELDSFVSTAPAIAKSEEGLYLAGQPGFVSKHNCCEDLFYHIAVISPFLSEGLKEGFSFEKNTFSYSHKPVLTRFEVISMDESISVPAGIFEHCLHTRYSSFVDEDDCQQNKKNKGTTDVWYAPGVGVVWITFVPIQGSRYINMKLNSYKVEAEDSKGLIDRYLPLATGNKWSYLAYDADGRPASDMYEYENLFEVVGRRLYDNAVIIAHSGWGVKRKQALD